MKISADVSNKFCPQTLFLYGTYKDDNTPNFGLFAWFSYCWDGGLSIMASIGGEKMTKDRIHVNKIFSANLVTEELLPIADYFGCVEGYSKDKMKIDIDVEKGHVLDVPVLVKSPWVYELEVTQTIVLDGSEVYICKIRNVLADEYLCDENTSAEKRIKKFRPVNTTSQTYFSWNGDAICPWGKAMERK